MSKPRQTQLEPRKTPQQQRSASSVEAIPQATVQVLLLQQGGTRLTTTRVAHRAGVSVGTLYQYFPNKSALLQALLKRHLDGTATAVEIACESLRGASLEAMADGITSAFLKAKFRDVETSVALYAISDDVEGKRIAAGMRVRITRAMAALFQTASPHAVAEPGVVAATLLSAMAGASRDLLEAGATRGAMTTLERELTRMARAYLMACAVDGRSDRKAGSYAAGPAVRGSAVTRPSA